MTSINDVLPMVQRLLIAGLDPSNFTETNIQPGITPPVSSLERLRRGLATGLLPVDELDEAQILTCIYAFVLEVAEYRRIGVGVQPDDDMAAARQFRRNTVKLFNAFMQTSFARGVKARGESQNSVVFDVLDTFYRDMGRFDFADDPNFPTYAPNYEFGKRKFRKPKKTETEEVEEQGDDLAALAEADQADLLAEDSDEMSDAEEFIDNDSGQSGEDTDMESGSEDESASDEEPEAEMTDDEDEESEDADIEDADMSDSD